MIDTVVCQECCEFMSGLKANTIKLTVTSPPYDGLRLYNGFTFNFELTARHLWRITEDGGVVVWVVADQTKNGSETGTSFKQALYFMSLGFKLHDTMLYGKLNFTPLTHRRYEQQFEYMFVFVKGKLKTFNGITEECKTVGFTHNLTKKGSPLKGGVMRRRSDEIVVKETKLHGNIFWYPTGSSRKTHEAVFPAQLAADHITTWSTVGDLVFDPFVGSGTTIEQAKKIGRRFLGCDISQEYVNQIHKNLELIENPLDAV